MGNRYAIDKTLAADDLRFHYRDWGGSGQPVLLLHGLASTGHIWDLVAPLLVDDFRVIALDLRGHGQSDKPEEGYDFEAVGGDVFNVIAELGMERPVIVGHSYGATVGLWVAARDAEAAGGLVLVDGGVMDLSEMTWDETLARLTPPKIGGIPLEAFRERLMQGAPQGLVTPAVEAAILANFEVDAENRLRRRLPRAQHLMILRAMWETPLLPLYKAVACPVLILPARRETDDPDMLERKARGVRLAQQTMADAEVTWLENTVHDAPLQRPHRLAEEITGFLRERVPAE